ncbi:hypothetical protein [Brachybacterium nesterenkovii]|uniref:Uncharacterized protein n=1 Tax=Brachybacterium nesterenkovii TaxID=47847 RepID=A0A1X6X8S5_9MICO|nr:hypothetical protein [Brachybacterium nesterenkovii]SLM95493.1 hypothetical protein FM110_12885 [Brachybacterium nesterenkovii]
MAFKGMNPDQGRDTAEAIKNAGTQTQELFETLTGQVQGVEWVGPDADTFKGDWTSYVGGIVAQVTDLYNTKSTDLNTHADEQDDTSNQN